MSFTHLHVHSTYSLLDGMVSPSKLAEAAAGLGMKALAITDHGSITGHISHTKACSKVGIKPILGVEAYFCDDPTQKEDRKLYHVVLLCKSMQGWHSLCRILTRANENFYYKPRIGLDDLLKSEDLILLTACAHGLVSHPEASRLLKKLKEKFEDDLYLELMPLDLDEQKIINLLAYRFSKKLNLKMVVTNDVHYTDQDSAEAHRFLLKMNTGGRIDFTISGLYLKPLDEMAFSCDEILTEDIPRNVWKKAIEATDEIVEKVNFELSEQTVSMPDVGTGDPDKMLAAISRLGLQKVIRGMDVDRVIEYGDRHKRELEVIRKKGFSQYFLVVHDLVQWAKGQGIEVGPGRGSAGGSLLCYVLGITRIDPIREGLLFERFLNEERQDWPDIDIDFQQSRRGEVLEYLRGKYGHDHVANINTLSELKPKSALKDTARALGISFEDSNQLTKHLEGAISVSEEAENNEEFKVVLRKIPDGKRLVRLADGISGTLRHEGTHAAGIVVSPHSLDGWAVMREQDGAAIVNWEMDDVPYLGWLKIDVLALRSLDIIQEAVNLIKDRHGFEINWDDIDVETEDILLPFGEGHTAGTFQFESNPMTKLCRQLNPITSKETLVHVNALGRPGPLDSGMTEKYTIRYQASIRNQGRYLGEKGGYAQYIRGITADTYEVIIYQEQIMKIAVEIAGHSIPESDLLRRVIAKSKGAEEFEKYRERFVTGCHEKSGMEIVEANMLFDDLANYSRYSFNKSHATAYTQLALWQMWLKVNFPLEYMAALFKWTSDDDKRKGYVNEARRLGIDIRMPDVNLSDTTLKISEGTLLAGFIDIKGIGEKAAQEIVEQRTYGDYQSLEEFRIRCSKKAVNKKVLECLVFAGAFDSLGVSHYQFHQHIDEVSDLADVKKKKTRATIPELYDLAEEFKDDVIASHKIQLLDVLYSVDPTMHLELKANDLASIQKEIATCQKCELWQHYEHPTPFEFSGNSRLMVVGEAPGQNEEKEGKPFVGKAGDILKKAMGELGIERPHLLIANVYNCRPEDNKLPKNVSHTCHDYLTRLIHLVRPGLVMAFGNTPLKYFTGRDGGIMSMCGKLQIEMVGGLAVPVIYCIHPASLRGDKDKQLLFKEAFEQLGRLIRR